MVIGLAEEGGAFNPDGLYDDVANYTDVGAASSRTPRFYRIRLVP